MAKGQQLSEDKAAVLAGGHGTAWGQVALVAHIRMQWLWWGQGDHSSRDRVAVVAGGHRSCMWMQWLGWLRSG